MSWQPIAFTVTRVCGRTPKCATWAIVSIELDDTHARAVAKCSSWPVSVDALVDRRFQASSKSVTGKDGDDQLQLYGVVEIEPSPPSSPSPQREQDASSVCLSSFRYCPDHESAAKRPCPPPGHTRWSARGGGRGRLDVLPDELLCKVLDHVGDDRKLARLGRVDTRMRRHLSLLFSIGSLVGLPLLGCALDFSFIM